MVKHISEAATSNDKKLEDIRDYNKLVLWLKEALPSLAEETSTK
jgi:hypothetical protein